MNEPRLTLATANAWLEEVLGQFPDDRIALDKLDVLSGDSVPGIYNELLVHTHHMTVTLEKRCGCPVFLEVIKIRHEGHDYARKLVLRAGEGGPVVLAGIMRFRLECVREEIRQAIVDASTPLGRILIENEVLRRIETVAFLRFPLQNTFGELLGAAGGEGFTYGRIAIIFCDDEPAVELLELIPPGI
jgi:hypothetical protein